MIEFKRKYQEFLIHPFPEGLAGKEINGIDLVMLDSEAAGLLQKFINSKGELKESDLKLLKDLACQLEYVISKLVSAEATYFKGLFELVSRVSALEKGQPL